MRFVDKLLDRYSKLKSDRSNFDNVWQEISDYFIPDQHGITSQKAQADNSRRRQIFSTTGGTSAEILASSLHSGLTNPSIKWFNLGLNETESQTEELDVFFEMSRDVIFSKLNNSGSGFPAQNHEFIFSLVTYGTACMFIEYSQSRDIKFNTVPIQHVYVSEDKYGEVDTIFRKMCLTKRQLLSRFGDRVHENHLKNRENDLDREVEVIHVILPAAEAEVTKNKMFNFASYYIDVENRHIMTVSGYYENPYILTRFSKLPNEIYGRSPAWHALPTVKMLNSINKSLLQGVQLQAAPPLLVADDGVLMPMQAKPNGLIHGGISMDGTERVRPLQVGANPQSIEAIIQMYNQQVRDMFFVDQASLSGANSYRTATEVIQIQQEKFKLLAPYIARLQTEYLTKLLDKVFNILIRDGELGEVPEQLLESEYNVVYTSPMAMLQKSSDVQQFNQFMQIAAPLVQINPSALDFIDFDKAIKKIAQDIGVWASIQKSEEQVISERRQRQEQQQVQQGIMEAQAGSQVGVDLSTIAANMAKTRPERVEITNTKA